MLDLFGPPAAGWTDPDVIIVVGVGADGWDGLPAASQAAVRSAQVLFGSRRQLALIPAGAGAAFARASAGAGAAFARASAGAGAALAGASAGADAADAVRVPWPSPLLAGLGPLLDSHEGRRRCVLASGDPLFFGIGSTLIELRGAARVRVLPQLSSAVLACARLGWAAESTTVLSVVGRPVAALARELMGGRRLLILSGDATSPGQVATLLCNGGFSASVLTVLEELGGPDERIRAGSVSDWLDPGLDIKPLNIIGVTCVPDSSGGGLTTVPGLPDDTFDHDGQLTKREVRALTLAQLGPRAGQLLWDVGAGAGSVAIEWLRADPSCRAIAFERDPGRLDRIRTNAERLGVPGLITVLGQAPASLSDKGGATGRQWPSGAEQLASPEQPIAAERLASPEQPSGAEQLASPEQPIAAEQLASAQQPSAAGPDAVFIGGGAGQDGVIEHCWRLLRPGGRLVVNAVTIESEAIICGWQRRLGGTLTRIEISRAAPVGGLTAWRPAMPVTQWAVTKPVGSP